MRRMSSVQFRDVNVWRGKGGGGLFLPLWRWQHSWGGNSPGHIYQCWQRSGMCVCVCVCVRERGDSLIPQRLNLPRSDGNRWIQLGQRGSGGGVVGKNQTWFQFRQRSGANTQPKSGVSIQSQLVWLYHMQDIYFRQFVGIFCFLFVDCLICFPFFFKNFWTVWLSRAWAGAAGW